MAFELDFSRGEVYLSRQDFHVSLCYDHSQAEKQHLRRTTSVSCAHRVHADCIDLYPLLTFSGQTVFKTQTLLANRAEKTFQNGGKKLRNII